MRDQSKPICPPLPPNFGERISVAQRSAAHYDRHIAPIVQWSLAEFGSRRAAHDALMHLRNDEDTSDTAYELLGQAVIVLSR